MSGFNSVANPGKIPTSGEGRSISPDDLFFGKKGRSEYQKIIDASPSQSIKTDFNVKKVKVRIFDLSDDRQRKAYEKLWSELLVRSSKMEVIVEASRDLVKRPDGTSYWMKYVEYVELGDESRRNEK